MRWITFDCYGTLLDWQTGFRRILEPVAGSRTDAVVHAFHDTEPRVQAGNPRASYREILREGLELAGRQAAALGVEPDLVITSEAVGSYKPAPGHFERFERETGVARADWVHAAVSWWHDMVPARELGLRRIWVDRENSGHDPSVVTARVPDMASLARLELA